MDVLTTRVALPQAGADRAMGRLSTTNTPALPAVAVILAAGIAAVWIAVQLLRRDQALATPAYDQAFFQQVIWNLDHGRGFANSFNQNSFLGVHFSPLLLVPAALELAWPDPRLLTLINSAAVALTAPAAFLFLRAAFAPSRLGAYLAAGLAAALPFTPTMQEAARAAFHPETVALPAAFVAGWAGLTGRRTAMWAAAAIPLLAKEDQVYTVAVIGLLLAARGRPGMRRHGVLLVAVAVAWGMALFGVVMPGLRAGAATDTTSYYAWMGPFPAQVLAPFREPSAVVAQLTMVEGWGAAAGLMLCVCGLPLLRPAWALLVLPPLVANLLSRHYPQPELHLQYGLLLVVPTVVAAAMGGRTALAFARRRLGRTPPGVRQRLAMALSAAAVPALVLGAAAGSLPPAAHASSAFVREPGWDRLTSVTRIIPPGAPVDVDDGLAAPLASRPTIFVLPRDCADCYVVVDAASTGWSFMSATERAALLSALPAERRLLADDGRFEVWSPVDG